MAKKFKHEPLTEEEIQFIYDMRQRRQEDASKGLAYHTARPLYVVYQVRSFCRPHDSDWSDCMTNHPRYKRHRYIRADDEGNTKKAESDQTYWDVPRGKWSPVIMECFYDVFVTVCFSRQDADTYIEKNKHNLFAPYVYVEANDYKNWTVTNLLQILGDGRNGDGASKYYDKIDRKRAKSKLKNER